MADVRDCGTVRATLQGLGLGYFGEFSGYALPIKHSDQVPRDGTQRYCPLGTEYGRIQVTKTGPFTRIVVFDIRERVMVP